MSLIRTWLIVLMTSLPIWWGHAQMPLPNTSPTAQAIRRVFDQLTYAFANNRPQPQLIVVAKSVRKTPVIVQYLPGNQPTVRMDEEVYQLCRSLGRDSLNALAILLGHELAHHYEKHDWSVAFGIGNATQSVTTEETRRLEAEADFYGCFYGEVAGYATGTVFPRILDLIYNHFQLSDQLPGYLSRAERKVIYAYKQAEAFDLAGVFWAGQLLYLIKDYESASSCFNLLTNRFPSREMFSNLSACRLQLALTLGQSFNFAYPIELDARSRLAATLRTGTQDDRRRLSLLQQAKHDAAKAREIDPDFVPAYINLACAHLLLDNPNAALGVINELPRPTTSSHTIRAIALYQDGQRERASLAFQEAYKQGGYMADYNLNLYKKLESPLTSGISQWIQQWFVDNSAPQPARRTGLLVRPMISKAEATRKPLPVSEVPYVRIARGKVQANILLIQAGVKAYIVRRNQPATGLRIAMSSQNLTTRFGSPTYRSLGPNTSFWVYRDTGLIVSLDKQNRVMYWFIYDTDV